MNLGIVIPVFDDWESCRRLLGELATSLGRASFSRPVSATIYVVDDGSTQCLDPADLTPGGLAVQLVYLACNMGNQRAIALGLCVAQRNVALDAVAVMDGDGEDRPEDLIKLIDTFLDSQDAPGAVVVARRTQRSEGWMFRGFYQAYRAFFSALTGKQLEFGNFCLIPKASLDRLVYVPDIWNNLAAAIHRSRLGICAVHTARGVRYAGRSSTSLTSLIVHGLSSVSVYSDIVFVRVLLLSCFVAGTAFVGILSALSLKLFTEFATPGWTTTMVGMLAIISLQLAMFSVAASFLLLSNRTQSVTVPAMRADEYIRSVEILSESGAMGSSDEA